MADGIGIPRDTISYAKMRYQSSVNNVEFIVGDAMNTPLNSSKIDVLVFIRNNRALEGSKRISR